MPCLPANQKPAFLCVIPVSLGSAWGVPKHGLTWQADNAKKNNNKPKQCQGPCLSQGFPGARCLQFISKIFKIYTMGRNIVWVEFHL